MKKSYWMGVTTHTENQRRAVLSWFGAVCHGMTVEKAEILCDIETDREKKIKAVVRNDDGKRYLATRTVGGKTYTVTLAPIREKVAAVAGLGGESAANERTPN